MATEIIELLNERRKKKKMRFNDLASATNISRKYLSEIFNNKVNPSLDIVCRLANAIGMKLVVKGVRKNENGTEGR